MGYGPLNDVFHLDLTLGCYILHLHLETGGAALPNMDEQNRC